jgi:hypothetical protein
MTPCRQLFLDRPLGRSRDERSQGVEWLGLGRAKNTVSKINPIFDNFSVTVFYLEMNSSQTSDFVC